MRRDGASLALFAGTVSPNSISGESRKEGTAIFSVVAIAYYIYAKAICFTKTDGGAVHMFEGSHPLRTL